METFSPVKMSAVPTIQTTRGSSVPAGDVAAVQRYREECAFADEVIAAHGPSEEPAEWPEQFGSWRLSNLYEIMLHVVTETACHAGHLDIIRETIDKTQYSVVG